MTNKESIQIIKEAIVKLENKNNSLDFITLQELAAFNIAIKALEQMDGPNWETAPDWANYYGIDADGQRWWYELEPELKGITYSNKGELKVDNLPDRMKLYKKPEQ